jgi:hypothetical protein
MVSDFIINTIYNFYLFCMCEIFFLILNHPHPYFFFLVFVKGKNKTKQKKKNKLMKKTIQKTLKFDVKYFFSNELTRDIKVGN